MENVEKKFEQVGQAAVVARYRTIYDKCKTVHAAAMEMINRADETYKDEFLALVLNCTAAEFELLLQSGELSSFDLSIAVTARTNAVLHGDTYELKADDTSGSEVPKADPCDAVRCAVEMLFGRLP